MHRLALLIVIQLYHTYTLSIETTLNTNTI